MPIRHKVTQHSVLFDILLPVVYFVVVCVVCNDVNKRCVDRLLVRIMPPVTDKCKIPMNRKFGCRSKQVPRLLKVAKEMELDVVGVR